MGTCTILLAMLSIVLTIFFEMFGSQLLIFKNQIYEKTRKDQSERS